MGIYVGRKLLIAAFLAGVALVVFGVVLGMVIFPAAVRSRILENVQLRRGSDAMERFIRQPQPVVLRVYFFNVTNPAEAQSGRSPPRLQQLGPYSYHIYREKSEIEEDFTMDTLSFYQKSQYFFRRELSVGDEDDVVTILNVPLMGIIDQATKSLPMLPPFFSYVLQDLFTDPKVMYTSYQRSNFSPFLTASVGKLMFKGVPIRCSRRSILRGLSKSLLCASLGMNLPQSIRKAEDGDDTEKGNFLFSFLGYKNNSREGPALIRRGLKNPEEVGELLMWKHQTEMHAWGPPDSSDCNKVVGVDPSTFTPFRDEKSVLRVFQPELCRTVTASFEKHVEYKGIPAIRYVADVNLFASPDVNPDNWCFYPTGDNNARDRYWAMTESGVQDLSSCLGAPIVVSYPHFYGASSSYLRYAKGLKPEKSLHETFVDIERMTGSPLNATKKLQFNMYLRRNKMIPFIRNVSEGLFPIMWAEEGMLLDEKFTKLLSEGLIDVVRLLEIIKWTMISLGVLEMIAVLIYARTRWMSRSGDSADQKMKEAYQLPCYEVSKTTFQSGDCKAKENEKPPK